VGTAAPPEVGPANIRFAVCVMNDPVSVPEEVTGDPVTLNTDTGKAKATLVTVPMSGAETVMDPGPGVIVIPVPALNEDTTGTPKLPI
jgi:hypothetical protein